MDILESESDHDEDLNCDESYQPITYWNKIQRCSEFNSPDERHSYANAPAILPKVFPLAPVGSPKMEDIFENSMQNAIEFGNVLYSSQA